jgi:hypothetical protein
MKWRVVTVASIWLLLVFKLPAWLAVNFAKDIALNHESGDRSAQSLAELVIDDQIGQRRIAVISICVMRCNNRQAALVKEEKVIK